MLAPKLDMYNLVMTELDVMTIFGQRLKIARKKRGLTQQAAADMFGVSLRAYCRWEKGERDPGLDTIVFIAVMFGVSIDWLLGRVDADVFDEPQTGLQDRPKSQNPQS